MDIKMKDEPIVNGTEPLTEEIFRDLYKYQPPEKKKLLRAPNCSTVTLTNALPIVKWLPAYPYRRDIINDVIAGLTVAVMHIPHGLAYGPLARQAPVVGLYMAVFPTIMYVLFGTSRHISLGTFAIVCMMVGEVVHNHASYYTTEVEVGARLMPNISDVAEYSNVQVVVSISFLVGALQFFMGVLHLGSLWLLLSDSLVSGFTTGAAVHVATYQIKNLLGVSGGGFRGAFKWQLTIIHLVKQVPLTNWITFGVSFCSILILATFNDQIKPRIQRRFPKFKVPVPIELIVIILGIAVSFFLDLSDNYGVKIVKTIPKGLPEPVIPVFEIMPKILVDCFVIAVVAISINLSLASIFAKRGGYIIRQNQELVAYGLANLFSSFFQCAPSAASLSRSLVQSAVGGKSLIASIVTILCIILILLFLGFFFEPVPYCVLSSIVVVTLKGLMWQVKDFPGIWKQSKLDGAVWLATFVSVVLIDLDIGLGVGLVMSVISLVIRGQNPTVVQLARLPQSNIFVDATAYPNAKQVSPHILMLRVSGVLHFANFPAFQTNFLRFYRRFMNLHILKDERINLFVVVDMSGVPSIDPTAAAGFAEINKDLSVDHCQMYLTDVSPPIYDYLDKCLFFEKFSKKNVIFSLFDAAEYLNERNS